MIARLRARHRSSEGGFTLVDVVASFVIMGIIVVPLCSALFQGMKLVPSSGERAKLATDADRFLRLVSDDTASSYSIQNFAAPGAPYALDTTQAPWRQDSTGPTLVSCGTNAFLLWHKIKDLGDGGTLDAQWLYGITFTGSGSRRSVTISRNDLIAGHPSDTIVTGYCNVGDANVLSLRTFAPSGTSSNERVEYKLNLRDSYGNSQPQIVVSATVRATQVTTP